jgi:2-amino-4-hydroxy-6-hydroxymethyldihydropteridine diphosphokinase
MPRAVVGLGANVGNPLAQLRAAIAAIGGLPGTALAAVSSFYRSAPLGYVDQPDFINAAVVIETALEPAALLAALQGIEAAAGRRRSFANAPRPLDLDLLLYDGREIDEPGLTVPHPRLHERAFALVPLLELEPDAAIPGRGRAAELLAALVDQRVERLACS